MTNEEILKAARNNKPNGKEYENKTGTRSALWGSLVAFILGIILATVEYLIKGTLNIGLIAVGLTGGGVQYLYEGIKTKTVWKIIFGAAESLLALFFALAFFASMGAVE